MSNEVRLYSIDSVVNNYDTSALPFVVRYLDALWASACMHAFRKMKIGIKPQSKLG